VACGPAAIGVWPNESVTGTAEGCGELREAVANKAGLKPIPGLNEASGASKAGGRPPGCALLGKSCAETKVPLLIMVRLTRYSQTSASSRRRHSGPPEPELSGTLPLERSGQHPLISNMNASLPSPTDPVRSPVGEFRGDSQQPTVPFPPRVKSTRGECANIDPLRAVLRRFSPTCRAAPWCAPEIGNDDSSGFPGMDQGPALRFVRGVFDACRHLRLRLRRGEKCGLAVSMQSNHFPRMSSRKPIGVGLALAATPNVSVEKRHAASGGPTSQLHRYGLAV